MSFEVGERVVCVNAKHVDWFVSPLVEGRVYTVSAVGVVGGCLFDGRHSSANVSVQLQGVPNPHSRGRSKDFFDARRFRKIERRDISQSLKALKDLTVNCPPLVEVE